MKLHIQSHFSSSLLLHVYKFRFKTISFCCNPREMGSFLCRSLWSPVFSFWEWLQKALLALLVAFWELGGVFWYFLSHGFSHTCRTKWLVIRITADVFGVIKTLTMSADVSTSNCVFFLRIPNSNLIKFCCLLQKNPVSPTYYFST